MSHGGQHGAEGQDGREVHIEEDGAIICVCGARIQFLPEEMPEGGPNSVNHSGCPAALHGEETINLIARDQVEAFFGREKDGHARKPEVRSG